MLNLVCRKSEYVKENFIVNIVDDLDDIHIKSGSVIHVRSGTLNMLDGVILTCDIS